MLFWVLVELAQHMAQFGFFGSSLMALLFIGTSIRVRVHNCTFPIHNLSLTHRAILQDSKTFGIG